MHYPIRLVSFTGLAVAAFGVRKPKSRAANAVRITEVSGSFVENPGKVAYFGHLGPQCWSQAGIVFCAGGLMLIACICLQADPGL